MVEYLMEAFKVPIDQAREALEMASWDTNRATDVLQQWKVHDSPAPAAVPTTAALPAEAPKSSSKLEPCDGLLGLLEEFGIALHYEALRGICSEQGADTIDDLLLLDEVDVAAQLHMNKF